jgi:hypothetical protein
LDPQVPLEAVEAVTKQAQVVPKQKKKPGKAAEVRNTTAQLALTKNPGKVAEAATKTAQVALTKNPGKAAEAATKTALMVLRKKPEKAAEVNKLKCSLHETEPPLRLPGRS